MDIRSTLAAQQYAATRPATEAKPVPGGNGAADGPVQSFAAAIENGEQEVLAALTGGSDAQSLVEALAQTQLAVETVATVRDKVVEAYQEILRMPV